MSNPGDAAGVTFTWDDIQTEAIALLGALEAAKVEVRVVGSAGIRLHCSNPGPLMDQLERPAKDIDVIVAQEHRKELRRTMEARGYVIDRDLLIAMEGRRYSFLCS